MLKSLNQRLAVYVILPVALVLSVMGLFAFLYARDALLEEWKKAAVLKLERAAHRLDMRLDQPVEWVRMLGKTAERQGGPAVGDWVLDQLRNMDGVSGINLEWPDGGTGSPGRMGMMTPRMGGTGMMPFHRARIAEVTPPRYDARTGQKTVTLITELKDESGGPAGTLKVDLAFEFLMQDITSFGWWQSESACLVDLSGRFLATTKALEGRGRLGETGNEVELAILNAMTEESAGTRLGPGHPADLVGGFYRVKRAPWVLVMFAPGRKVLAPIVQFRNYYAVAAVLCIAAIALLIRIAGARIVKPVKEVSRAAEQVAEGDYGPPLIARTSDEVGQLIRSFNRMVEGLKERDFISNTFGRYVDKGIARRILSRPETAGLGGEKRPVAILMSDIRGFTDLAETLAPEGTISVLNHYFSHMIRVIQEHEGIIVDFFGDGVLVFFDPLDKPLEPKIRQALRCALAMQNEMGEINEEMRAEGLPDISMGIGVNAGEVVVGNIGSEARAKYGIVGSAVNLTQRIQTQAREGEVIVSEAVYGSLSDEIKVERTLTVQVKGLQDAVRLYVIKAADKAAPPGPAGNFVDNRDKVF